MGNDTSETTRTTPSDGDRAWRLIDQRPVHQGWLNVVARTYELPSGERVEWEMLSAGHAVTVLPLTADGRVLAIRQYRPGPGCVVLNLPGGLIDDGETPEEAARRELTEETGYVAGELEVLGDFWVSSVQTAKGWVAIARGCQPIGIQALETGEDCEPVLITLDELRAELRAGRMTGSAAVYLCLDRAGLL